MAAAIVEDLAGSDLCLDLHASNIFLQEIPQVRMSESTAEQLLPYARHLNADLIWIHASATVLESTLAHSLNLCGVPTLVVEMGAGMRVNRAYCEQILTGILNLLRILGIWQGPVPGEKEPQISLDRQVEILHAGTAGLFVPSVSHGVQVRKGERIGDVVSPLTGEVQEQICAGMDGLLFTLREYPMVYEGALVGRILGGGLG